MGVSRPVVQLDEGSVAGVGLFRGSVTRWFCFTVVQLHSSSVTWVQLLVVQLHGGSVIHTP